MASALCNKSLAGAKVQARPVSRRTSVVVQASGRRELLGLGALVALTSLAPAAQAGLTEDLLAKSSVNKALNDKKRLASSYANLARSRTVADGTCTVFTNNFFGCEELAPKPVKYIAEDIKLECEGKEKGKCASRMTGFIKK
mmetsp:Transcript_199/g.361  ORF Transcript_199/g.361 Transcript_199/m.361 type:complete len:142 (-) Transcript_199:513-938(-)|eukprot:CAMPEP_0202893006 /NCGR_PEP_ID=MMETSP1392-20130828/2663_1 /ASSEMBLY_ACC=CAM_ASM_000868 /TAXON_ID=225041 /ORGANISM="Chlamydomonas chlamydogama, Strain SAG 11-48b" /LENGTH=141 /DNA_ID=CAMNT_0049577179 /DNA_START=77 /DNA_END=502 /DNA_ORIENTATION=-